MNKYTKTILSNGENFIKFIYSNKYEIFQINKPKLFLMENNTIYSKWIINEIKKKNILFHIHQIVEQY